MPDLYTFGEAMALFLSEDTDSVIDAKLYRRSTAGAEGNVAVAVSRLGLHAHFYTHLGQDELGTAILDDFIAEGVADLRLRERDARHGAGLGDGEVLAAHGWDGFCRK